MGGVCSPVRTGIANLFTPTTWSCHTLLYVRPNPLKIPFLVKMAINYTAQSFLRNCNQLSRAWAKGKKLASTIMKNLNKLKVNDSSLLSMIARDSWCSDESASFKSHRLTSTTIHYHAPFDQGFIIISLRPNNSSPYPFGDYV